MIKKEDSTSNREGYVRGMMMYKKDKLQLESAVNILCENFDFNGLYHFTDFTNLGMIFETEYLRSRQECEEKRIEFLDAADQEVIHHTDYNVKNCVRFYYKEKTPTLYRNEGIKYNNKEPHIPIPVYLLFNIELIYLDSTIFSNCNAASRFAEFGNTYEFFTNMDWEKIFHRESLPLEDCPEKWDIIRKRNAELLSLEPVSLDYLNKIIFRSITDLKRAKNAFGSNSKYEVNNNLFNCHNHYIIDYKIDTNRRSKSKDIIVSLEFNNNTFENYEHKYRFINIKNGKCIKSNLVTFKDKINIKRKGTISGLPNINLKFEYYINDILCIEDYV